MTTLRVLIVDDEPLARERIRSLLATETDFTIVGEEGSGSAAVTSIRDREVDVVFLDVQMPGLDGFGVVEHVGFADMPLTVFVTAYDQHAVRAFEAYALDYLLKPFDRERFGRTLDRIRSHFASRGDAGVSRKLDQLLRTLDRRTPYIDQFVIRTGPKHVIVRLQDVDVITSEGNYLRLHTAGRSYLLRETMARIEEQLDPEEFLRIHRSTVVRISRIVELESVFEGEYVVTLQNGTKLNSSRTYRERLQVAVRMGSTRTDK